ncbi:uncharacterized protein LOC129589164 [Paramacrobiotus metropolitanus]|uniref:uncharacterized protein LOC129589164 n=1 Tax=Paramacrobiotus metropolitanus TaxID=2943436 RepID=UPI002445F7F1|nr:uncharacterized protein LOC129589164 [Paramacrobiotus metropolitanus]
MKCRSPFIWILHCLKSAWRLLCGKKRPNPETAGPLTGVTVNPAPSSPLVQQGSDAWSSNWDNAPSVNSSSEPAAMSSLGLTRGNSVKYSATEAWRESLIKQKTAPPPPPEVEEEQNFFDHMEPTLRKPKMVKVWSDAESAAQDEFSSRLSFKPAAVPNLKAELDWMEEGEGAGSWEASIDEIDPRAAKKAKRKAAKEQAASSAQQTQDARVRKQMV